jgi:hypothetical protein
MNLTYIQAPGYHYDELKHMERSLLVLALFYRAILGQNFAKFGLLLFN